MDEAIAILEFAVGIGSDISLHYTTLASYYKNTQANDKLASLKEQAMVLDSIMQPAILEKINTIESNV